MKFVISSKAIFNLLQSIGHVVNSKNSIAILDNFVFDIKDGELTVTASDSETTVSSKILLSESDSNGSFCVAAKTMVNALKDIPEQPLSFHMDMSTYQLTVSYLNGHYSLMGQNAESYPTPAPLEENLNTITVKSSTLIKAVERALYATASDSYRMVMTGVFFDAYGDDLVIVATDGHKLVRTRNISKGNAESCGFILSKKPAQMLRNLFSADETEVTVEFDQRGAVFSSADARMTCRLVEGKYPAYQAVIPENNPLVATVDRQALLSAVKRVLVFSSVSAMLVKLSFNQNQITISGQDVDFSTSAEERLLCTYDDRPISIGFKGSFLVEILNNMPSDEVKIKLADASRPVVIEPAETDEEEKLLMLLMPIMIDI